MLVEADGHALQFSGHRRINLHHPRIVTRDDMVAGVCELAYAAVAVEQRLDVVDQREDEVVTAIRVKVCGV